MSEAEEVVTPARRFGWRDGARWFGIACLLAAAFLGGYVSWLLWGTGITTQRAQNELRPQIEQQIAHPRQGTGAPILPGKAYAVIEIPRIGLNMVVVQGVDTTDLESGPGHYPDTADPWDAKGRVGTIQRCHGSFTNPETRAYGESGLPEKRLYLVRFENGHTVSADIFEHWLEAE